MKLMEGLFKYALPIIAVIGMAVYVDLNINAEAPPQKISGLELAGDACDAIAEKAAMQLPEVLPFQKLEKAARRAKVVETCMHDRAYIENPAWPAYAKAIAQKNAAAQQISVDEAYENLKRISMMQFKPMNSEPLYWLATNPR